MAKCQLCGSLELGDFFELKNHTISSQFTKKNDNDVIKIDIQLCQCNHCGLIQLLQPVPYEKLISPYDWIFAREPEGHLDSIVDYLIDKCKLSSSANILGLSYKDETTLKRFKNKGFAKIRLLDVANDLGILSKNAKIESIQSKINMESVISLKEKLGQADVIIARHIIENAQDLAGFLRALLYLLSDEGLLIIESPDCSKCLDLNDYTMLWEEHAVYFTNQTFQNLSYFLNFKKIKSFSFEEHYQNQLVLIVQKECEDSFQSMKTLKKDNNDIKRYKSYVSSFAKNRIKLFNFLQQYTEKVGAIAIFGAGHHAHMFINIMQISEFITFIIDDTPQKQGLFFPGTNIPIVSSDELIAPKVKLCLFGLSIGSEDKIIQKHKHFIDAGGCFYSIYRSSSRSIFNEI